MFINFLYFLIRMFCKIFGVSFSFSNDGEDLILMKYLNKIKNGNYIDIGSHKPIKISNTFLFYLSGWKGICIDPLPFLKKKYRFFRRSDKFINSGVLTSKSDYQKEINFYYYKKYSDLSTFDPDRVEDLRKTYGREPSSIIPVSKITVFDLISISKDLFGHNNAIHLLSLDIEGFELDILNDFFSNKVYPWIICVEEIGQTAETLINGKIYKLMKSNGYILGSRTFLSSIYVSRSILSKLPSDYIKELKI